MKEDNYREALRKRTIEPSANSWDKLNDQLDAQADKSKNRKWFILKIASVLLVFISVGFYFTRQDENKINEPKIVSPNMIEIQEASPEQEELNATETVMTPKTNNFDSQPEIDPVKHKTIAVKVNFKQSAIENESENIEQITMLDSVTEAILLTETIDPDKLNIDHEVEELLAKSRIKLVVNGQISTQKVVDANALLNAVEEDIYKDLKQKLIEKISNSLKNPKEVITSRDD